MTHELSPELLSGIITALGSEWRLVPLCDENNTWERHSSRQLEYVGPDPLLTGAAIYLRGIESNRLEVQGKLHANSPESPYWQYLGDYVSRNTSDSFKRTITVSLSKTPEKIARDITCRLLPDYLAGFREAIQKWQMYQAGYRRANELAAHLASLIGPGASARCESSRNKDAQVYFYSRQGDCPTLDMRVHSNGVYIDRLSGLSIAQAEEFCEMLARWRDQSSKGKNVDVVV